MQFSWRDALRRVLFDFYQWRHVNLHSLFANREYVNHVLGYAMTLVQWITTGI